MGLFSKKPDQRTEMLLSGLAEQAISVLGEPSINKHLLFENVEVDLTEVNIQNSIAAEITDLLDTMKFEDLTPSESRNKMDQYNNDLDKIEGTEDYPIKFICIHASNCHHENRYIDSHIER